jgi:DNA-damage-inducible protein D
MNDNLPVKGQKSFEELKKTNKHGAEYWSARDLQPLLGYAKWRRFEDAIKRAIISCQQSGNKPDYHFAGAGKPIIGGKGAVQEVVDYHLSRFASEINIFIFQPQRTQSSQRYKLFKV